MTKNILLTLLVAVFVAPAFGQVRNPEREIEKAFKGSELVLGAGIGTHFQGEIEIDLPEKVLSSHLFNRSTVFLFAVSDPDLDAEVYYSDEDNYSVDLSAETGSLFNLIQVGIVGRGAGAGAFSVGALNPSVRNARTIIDGARDENGNVLVPIGILNVQGALVSMVNKGRGVMSLQGGAEIGYEVFEGEIVTSFQGEGSIAGPTTIPIKGVTLRASYEDLPNSLSIVQGDLGIANSLTGAFVPYVGFERRSFQVDEVSYGQNFLTFGAQISTR